MVIPKGDAQGYELAYEEGKKAVAAQGETLKETRDRVGALVSAAAVVAGLSAALAFDSSRVTRLGPWGAVATVAAAMGFGTIAVAAVRIWRPFPGIFTLDAGMIVGFLRGGTFPGVVGRDPPRAGHTPWHPQPVQPGPARPQTHLVRRSIAGVPTCDRRSHARALGRSVMTAPTPPQAPPPPAPSRPDPGITEKKGAPLPSRPTR